MCLFVIGRPRSCSAISGSTAANSASSWRRFSSAAWGRIVRGQAANHCFSGLTRKSVSHPAAACSTSSDRASSSNGSGTWPFGNRSATSTSRALASLISVALLGLRCPFSIWLTPDTAISAAAASFVWPQPLASLSRRISLPSSPIVPPDRELSLRSHLKEGLSICEEVGGVFGGLLPVILFLCNRRPYCVVFVHKETMILPSPYPCPCIFIQYPNI